MTTSLFEGLDPDRLQRVLAFFDQVLSYDPYDLIMLEGETGTSLLLIEKGNALIKVGGKEVGALETGDCVGEVGFVTGRPRTASVFAGSGGCSARLIQPDDFDRFGLFDPSAALCIAQNVNRLLAAKLTRANQSFRELLGELEDAERERSELREARAQSFFQRLLGGLGT